MGTGDLVADFRKAALSYRRSLSTAERKARSDQIAFAFEKIIAQKEERLPVTGQLVEQLQLPILCFYPLSDEVDLRDLYGKLLSVGRRLFFPVTQGAEISFFQVWDLACFKEGHFHVMEPVDRSQPFCEENYISITPGLAFDKQGNRVGFGKGYYDRFFSKYPNGYKVGVAFAGQIYEKIPAAKWDVPMDIVITELSANR